MRPFARAVGGRFGGLWSGGGDMRSAVGRGMGVRLWRVGGGVRCRLGGVDGCWGWHGCE